MAAKGIWVEQVDKRTRNGKKRVDSLDPRHFESVKSTKKDAQSRLHELLVSVD